MRLAPSLCLLALSLVYAFQGAPTPVRKPTPARGPTPLIEPFRPEHRDSKLAMLNESEILVVNMIPNDQSDEHAQDSEPFLAVNKADETLMVGAAFRGQNQPTGATPLILLSSDAGRTWKLGSILPAPQIAAQTYCFSGKNKNFYGSVMTIEGTQRTVSVFHSNDPTTDQALENISTLSSGAEFGDAPFIQAHTFGAAPAEGEPDNRIDRIYVGQNYFGFAGQQRNKTASIRVSIDNGKNFRLVGIEARETGEVGQDGPAVRPAIANDGTVYVAFLHWHANEGNRIRGDVVVTRDDHGAAGPNPFRSLVDASDGLPGRMLSRNSLFSPSERLGKQRIVSPLSLAVDPLHSDNVYVAWGDYDAAKKSHFLHLKRSTDRGQNWTEDLLSIESATNPALAVSHSGVLGLLYQQLADRRSKSERWETHFRSSPDGGVHWTDVPLATFPAAPEPKLEADPYLGYRSHLLAVNNNFYGIFSAPNTPNQKYFPQGVIFQRNYLIDQILSTDRQHEVPVSIDPYFFRIDLTPRPSSNVAAADPPATVLSASFTTYFVPIAVVVSLLLLGLGIVQLWRARTVSLKAGTPQGPEMINYSGYVVLGFTDLNGNPIEPGSLPKAFQLIVKFTDTLQEDELGEEINLSGGKHAPEVVFTIVIDSIDYDVTPDHITDKVPAKGTREFTFNVSQSEPGEGESLYVQIYQRTRLVQVVAPRFADAYRGI